MRWRVQWALVAVAAAGCGGPGTATYRAPEDCIEVENLGAELSAEMGQRVSQVAAIHSGHDGYENLTYIAVIFEPGTPAAVWAANISDGSLTAPYASFIPVNAEAKATGLTVGPLDPPESDAAAAEAIECAQRAPMERA